MNLKSITNLPQLETVADTDYVIVNSNGRAMQAPASEMGGSKKELMYDFTYLDENGVAVPMDELIQNIDENLDWLTKYSKDIDFEIVFIFDEYDSTGSALTRSETIVVTKTNVVRTTYYSPSGNVDEMRFYIMDPMSDPIGMCIILNGIYYDDEGEELFDANKGSIEA